MDWRDAAAGGLPAPRDDEPSSLRQNILDELADHLDCACERAVQEHHARGSDRQRQTALRRSAGPGAPTLGGRHEGHDHVEATHAGRDGIDDGDVSVVRLDRLERTSRQSGNGRINHSRERRTHRTTVGAAGCQARRLLPLPVPERAEVHFHLVCDDAQKSPAKGFEAKLYLAGSGASLNPLLRTSDEQGNLDFGMLPAGSYMLRVTTPWHEFRAHSRRSVALFSHYISDCLSRPPISGRPTSSSSSPACLRSKTGMH